MDGGVDDGGYKVVDVWVSVVCELPGPGALGATDDLAVAATKECAVGVGATDEAGVNSVAVGAGAAFAGGVVVAETCSVGVCGNVWDGPGGHADASTGELHVCGKPHAVGTVVDDLEEFVEFRGLNFANARHNVAARAKDEK